MGIPTGDTQNTRDLGTGYPKHGGTQITVTPLSGPDFELRRGPGHILTAQSAFLPLVISSFFTQNKGGGGGSGPLP